MNTMNAIASNPHAPPHTGSIGIGGHKLIIGALCFVALTGAVLYYQFSLIQDGSAPPRWDQLRWIYFLLILLFLPVETLASATRLWLVCRVLQPGIGLWSCIKAEWANIAVSTLTPSQTGGGPAQVYMLGRDGVKAATALTISLISFMGTMVALICIGLYLLFVSGMAQTGGLFVAAVWTLVSISGAMLLAGVWPGFFRGALGALSRTVWRLAGKRYPLYEWRRPGDARIGEPVDRLDRFTTKLVDLLYGYRSDCARFLRDGKTTFVGVGLLSLVFLFSRCFIPYLCIRFLGIESSDLRHILEAQLALTFLVFFAPTPGSAGVAEAASMTLMSEIMPAGFAMVYTLLWRFSTVYLTAIAGLFCLLRAVTQDAIRCIPNSGNSPRWRKTL
ncbi:MAG TPA: lysylphosphatidylglycerol synthase transmembrane domain-containing protein [Candidatus Binatia bacterium]|nr:lysylphosphatidylglycerol synthase transmembrane domain-containing protein [Candidatus Binatia bacterium]